MITINKIKELRQGIEITQSQLAEQLGIDTSTVSKWENGDSTPKTATLCELARIFHCTVDELLKQE